MIKAEKMLRQSGKRVTRQRVLILDIINQTKGHMAAEEIYRLAKQKSPRMSLSTIYRTLQVLKKDELVEELDLGNDRYHYEIKREDHHHMVCRGCGKVIEFQCPFCKEMMRHLAEENNFEITGVSLTLFGLCAECRRKKAGNSN